MTVETGSDEKLRLYCMNYEHIFFVKKTKIRIVSQLSKT